MHGLGSATEAAACRRPALRLEMQSALSSVLLHVRCTCAFNLSGDWRGWEAAPPPDAYIYGRPGGVGGWVVCLAPLPGCGPLGRMHMHQRHSAGRNREATRRVPRDGPRDVHRRDPNLLFVSLIDDLTDGIG